MNNPRPNIPSLFNDQTPIFLRNLNTETNSVISIEDQKPNFKTQKKIAKRKAGRTSRANSPSKA